MQPDPAHSAKRLACLITSMPSLQLGLVLYTNPAACLDYRNGQNQEIIKTVVAMFLMISWFCPFR